MNFFYCIMKKAYFSSSDSLQAFIYYRTINSLNFQRKNYKQIYIRDGKKDFDCVQQRCNNSGKCFILQDMVHYRLQEVLKYLIVEQYLVSDGLWSGSLAQFTQYLDKSFENYDVLFDASLYAAGNL